MKQIPLSKGFFAVVDDADYDAAMAFKWYARKTNGHVYAERHVNGVPGQLHTSLHRFLMGEPVGMTVDHINGDTLDNSRANLRICSHRENICNARLNSRNTSGYKGVSFDKRRGTWCAYIKVHSRRFSLGAYASADRAALAYDAAAKKFFGEFARTNFSE